MPDFTVKKAHDGLVKKEFSAVELAKEYLGQIKKVDKKISAFLEVTDKLALKQAKAVDEKISKGENISLLAGIPVAVKDNILVEGTRSTCASKILKDYVAPYDATVVRKLREAGAVILGKTNLDEFGMGASMENSGFFTTKNPSDSKRVPGGSSGGSAAAVAADMCVYALGSDTGGSIRQPASFCGVIGLKPTYGAVSRYGLVAFASSLDQIGPITKNAEDAEIAFKAISGRDPLDSTSIKFDFQALALNIKDLKIGVPKEYFVEGMDPKVEAVIKEAIKKIEKAGARIVEISLPCTKYALASYYLIATSEASANLARYDGIRYGLSKAGGKDLTEVYLHSRGEGFGDEVKRRIMLGTYVLSAGYYDAYYLQAQKIRTMLKQDFERAFQEVDVIFSPVSPTPAFKIGEKIEDPLLMYLSDILTISINLAGLPAVSVPAGLADNLPVGLQIIGKPFEENKILEVSKFFAS